MKRSNDPDVLGQEPGRLVLTNEGVIWLAVLLLLGGIGWFKNITLVLLLAYFMFMLLLLNGFLARLQARRVSVSREPSPPLYAGEDATMRVVVANTGSFPATTTVVDRSGDGEPTSWLVHRLPVGEAVTCAARRMFSKRGKHITPIRVESAFPFGLMRFACVGHTGTDVMILPKPGHANPDGLRRWVMRQSGSDGRARRVARRVTTDQADVRGVRPYRPGDAMRSVHWRSSARRGELMVREYDTAPAPDLVLVVEPWLPVQATPRDHERLEAALSLAVTLARVWGRVHGTRVTVAVAGDPDSIRTVPSDDEGIRLALSPLAAIVGGAVFEPFSPAAFGRSLARAARIVVSSRGLSPYAEALAQSTGRPFVTLAPSDHLDWYQEPT